MIIPLKKDHSDFEVELADVTPDMARKWLDNYNNSNRKVSSKTVKRYTRDMVRGAWAFNADPIRFAPSGRLLDGQHRLEALISANVTISMLIAYNVPESSFDTIDTGKNRNGADALFMAGCHSNYRMKATSIRHINAFKNGRTTKTVHNYAMTNNEIVEFYEETEDLEEVLESAAALMSCKRLLGAGVYGALYWLFWSKNRQDCKDFFHSLETGANLHVGSPMLHLRNKIQDLRARHGRLDCGEIMRLTVTAWIAYRQKRDVTYLKGSKFYVLKDIK